MGWSIRVWHAFELWAQDLTVFRGHRPAVSVHAWISLTSRTFCLSNQVQGKSYGPFFVPSIPNCPVKLSEWNRRSQKHDPWLSLWSLFWSRKNASNSVKCLSLPFLLPSMDLASCPGHGTPSDVNGNGSSLYGPNANCVTGNICCGGGEHNMYLSIPPPFFLLKKYSWYPSDLTYLCIALYFLTPCFPKTEPNPYKES